ncbi:uncharacterized protein ARMOST_20405 [Armillaria ostoyae]|uniref:Uncharacterized protein n=1 Tax=Armillaria ostoyae TaxID=47428 RepID=A0A284S791_ARMOS|nr:uncharacterized protein ARMOST_20405 [Armillaria ostoyae]
MPRPPMKRNGETQVAVMAPQIGRRAYSRRLYPRSAWARLSLRPRYATTLFHLSLFILSLDGCKYTTERHYLAQFHPIPSLEDAYCTAVLVFDNDTPALQRKITLLVSTLTAHPRLAASNDDRLYRSERTHYKIGLTDVEGGIADGGERSAKKNVKVGYQNIPSLGAARYQDRALSSVKPPESQDD